MKSNTTRHTVPRARMPEHELVQGDDWLDTYKSESEAATPLTRPSPSRRLPLLVVGLCVSLGAAGWLVWQTWTATAAVSAPLSTPAANGTANFASVPDGATISIDGTVRGITPLRISLPAGTHTVQITSGSVSRTLPITVEAGAVVSQYVELAVPQSSTGGRLEIGSDPPGANVSIDGVPRGVTPLVLTDVAPGQHRITVSAGENTVNRTVNVARGATATLVISTAPVASGAAGGWLTIQSPVDMEVLEDGRVLGNTRMERLMLPVGTHRLEFVNPDLELSTSRTVQITAGRTAAVSLVLPSGKLSINAVPWADVFLDGVALGPTPLGELSVPIGTHELVFRHPQFPERRQTVVVKARTPARIGIDLRK